MALGRTELRVAAAGKVVVLQPKRLGLLAYLAVAAPGRFVRRDLILPLFWPELDGPRARNALNKAVFYLRQVLGEGVLTGRGDDEVGLSGERFWCDAVALDEAVADQGWGEALELYRGDFLPGLYLSGAAPFEEWLEVERTRLRRQAARAARGAAEALMAGDDAPGAVEAARRAVSLAPDDEQAVRYLMALLDRLGDRAGALRVYEDFAARMRREFEVEPDTETRTLRKTVSGRVLPAEPE